MKTDRLDFPTLSGKYIKELLDRKTEYLTEDKVLMYEQEEFISACYRFFFWRDADEDGLKTHLELLNGGMSKDGMMHYFSRTPEFHQRFQLKNKEIYRRRYVEYQWDARHLLRHNGWRFIEECYHFLLEREPDEEGFYTFTKQLYKGVPKEGIIYFILDSEEIRNVKGIKDKDYYKNIYEQYCQEQRNRPEDEAVREDREREYHASMEADNAMMYYQLKNLTAEVKNQAASQTSLLQLDGKVMWYLEQLRKQNHQLEEQLAEVKKVLSGNEGERPREAKKGSGPWKS